MWGQFNCNFREYQNTKINIRTDLRNQEERIVSTKEQNKFLGKVIKMV